MPLEGRPVDAGAPNSRPGWYDTRTYVAGHALRPYRAADGSHGWRCECGEYAHGFPSRETARAAHLDHKVDYSPSVGEFADKVWMGRRNECWMPHGLPRFQGYRRYRSRPAHRWIYEALRGPVPAGMVPDHLCERMWCQNPWHMDVVGHGENAGRAKQRARDEFTCPSGHAWDEANTYIQPGTGYRTCRACRATGMRGRR